MKAAHCSMSNQLCLMLLLLLLVLQVNNMVYVFGGQLVKDGSVSHELFWMTSERMEWHAQPTRGDRPCGRYGHVAVYDPDHHQLVVFGGR
jgi:hypothetical protein